MKKGLIGNRRMDYSAVRRLQENQENQETRRCAIKTDFAKDQKHWKSPGKTEMILSEQITFSLFTTWTANTAN